MLFLATFSLVTLINAQSDVHSQLSKFFPATYPPDIKACANSTPDRSFAVNYLAQCVYECQHGDKRQVCVGVNFQQQSNSCEVYYQCPTTYTLDSPGCRFIQKSNQSGQKVCPVSVACDGNCTSGCAQLGPFKCDSRCKADYGLTTDNTCQPCDAKCSSGCFVQGAARCDSLCVFGFGMASNHTCQACDTRCSSSGCSVQGPGKCDSQCITGYGIASDHTCQPCGAQCAGGCLIQGAGKCDSPCYYGYGIAADHTCQACDAQCAGGCSAQGAGKCDSPCNSGYGIAADQTCQACGSQCAGGCSVQGAGKCDSLCSSGYGIAADHTCQACDAKCSSGCPGQGAGKCDSQCISGYGIASDHTCQACDAECAGGCSVQGAGKCDLPCYTGFGIAADHTCQACGSNCASSRALQGAGKCDSTCNTGYDLISGYICPANLAYQQAAVQISTWPTAIASLAVNGDFSDQSCTVSLGGMYGWWAVELAQATVVTSVKVTNDPDSNYAYRLSNFWVGVTNNSPFGREGTGLDAGTDFTVCTQYCCPVPAGATVEAVCTPSSTQYRYVIIRSSVNGQALCINEVQVY